MLFQTDIEKINAEITQLQELIAAKQQQQSQLLHLQNMADEAVKSVQNVICLLNSPNALSTLKSALVGLFDGINESSSTTPTPSVSILEPEVTPAPSCEDSEAKSVAEPELIQVSEQVSYRREADGQIHRTYIGFNNKSKAQSWGEWLTSSTVAIAEEFEVKPSTLLPFKYELHVWGLNLNQINKLAEQDFSKTPKGDLSASGIVSKTQPTPALVEEIEPGDTVASVLTPTTSNLNGRVTGNEISHASPKTGGSETQPTQTTAVIPAKVTPQLEDLEPGDLVGSLLVPGWTYQVLEIRPNGQLNCKRLLSSGESFNVDLDINGVYLLEKVAHGAPEPESLADAPINEGDSQYCSVKDGCPSKEAGEAGGEKTGLSDQSEPTTVQLEEPITPEKLAEFIRTAWSWEEIEAVTAGNEPYKKAAWSLLTQQEKDQVLALKLESQQKAQPTAEPEPPSIQPAVDDFQEGDEVEVTSTRHGEERVGEVGIVKVVNKHGVTVESGDGNVTYWYPEELKLLSQS